MNTTLKFGEPSNFILDITAMARINMIKAAVSRRTSAHAPLDNVTTPYNPMRLLKGAPPGQVLHSQFYSCILVVLMLYKTLMFYE